MFLFAYGQKERKKGNTYPIKHCLISLSILLFNFPAAVLAIYSADYVKGTSIVTVVNDSSFEVNSLFISERDQSYSFPPISPGQKVTKYFHFKYEGSVSYKLSLDCSSKEGGMFGYVTRGMGDRATMFIKKDGTIEIKR